MQIEESFRENLELYVKVKVNDPYDGDRIEQWTAQIG